MAEKITQPLPLDLGEFSRDAGGQKTSRAAFSGWPMLLGFAAMIIFAFHASTHMVGAGDTWVAMACGRHFLNHGVDTVEPFSANSHRPGPTAEEIEKWPGWAQWITDKVGIETVKYWHPTGWVNQNWLTHVMFYWLSHESPFADAEELSFNTLVYWKFAIYIITVFCVYYIARVLRANPALAALFACGAMFIGRSFFDIRPAGFSNLLAAVFFLILALATYRSILYIWLLIPLCVFWCNVHGGYIYAFIMLVPFTGMHILSLFLRKHFVSIDKKGIYHTIGAGFVSLIAVIIFNPFHLTNLTHTVVISVSEHAERWRSVNEWHPGFEWSNVVGTGFPFLVLVLVFVLTTILWLLSRLAKPRLLKAPINELHAQQSRYKVLTCCLGWAAAISLGWTIMVSCSWLRLNSVDFILSAFFIAIILLAVFENIHLIYLVLPLTLVFMQFANADKGYYGRYIYPFILVPLYAFAALISGAFCDKIKTKGFHILLVAASGVVTVILMTVLFDPFGLDSIKEMFSIRRQWRPVYEGPYKLNHRHLFVVLYIINAFAIAVWFAYRYLRQIFVKISTERQLNYESEQQALHTDGGQAFQLPRIDAALIVIAALTIYMAIQSRRFIPIAAITACPLLAVFINEMARTLCASHNFHKNKRLAVTSMPKTLQSFFVFAAAVAVICFGTWWTLKFKRVYLDAWPKDPKLTSVFMRMTASDAKPFYAGRFIRENNISGKMFNYWTEGGFIGWVQEPDPNTGKTPLQLFMDGRAQAAYDRDAYDHWASIMFGGPIVHAARQRRHKLNDSDYKKIGTWLSKQLRNDNVWIVLMPMNKNVVGGPFEEGLSHNQQWHVVFFNDKQKIWVDSKSEKGMKLLDDVKNQKVVFPTELSEDLMRSYVLTKYGQTLKDKRTALEYAEKALYGVPSRVAMVQVLTAGRYRQLAEQTNAICRAYVEDFEENRQQYIEQDGYRCRITSAQLAAYRLRSFAGQQKDSKLVKHYSQLIEQYDKMVRDIHTERYW